MPQTTIGKSKGDRAGLSDMYNFKHITLVPSSTDFIDATLSKTQRKTPTVVHPSYNITRIRDFYLRKIKHTHCNFHERLQLILEQFPKLEDIHPFYSDLINVLYDRDHYKVALGDVNKMKTLIDNVSRDYCRLMKYGDSLYRCKQLKRAAMGRMCTIVKGRKDTLQYLEEVRKHLSRLPSIDPNTRTLILCGFPNVGKSSFMNKLSRADVEVQPYAFTTKSLYVGHFDYQYIPWQVIDTPGILDKPLEERNTIEMLSITALAHLNAAVVYVMDISGQCGYSLEEQVNLFQSMKPLFKNNPIRLMLNKCDILKPSDLSEDQRQIIKDLCDPADFNEKKIPIQETSTVTEDGLIDLRNAICDDLLAKRATNKLKNTKGDAKVNMMDRLRVAKPTARDTVVREYFVPSGFKQKEKEIVNAKMHLGALPKQIYKVQENSKKTERDLYEEFNDDYVLDIRKHWDLPKSDQKYDTIPQIWEGKNIADYIDPEIETKLAALLAEEEAREEAGFYDIDREVDDEDMVELRQLGKHIKKKKDVHMQLNKRERRIQQAQVDRRCTSKMAGTSTDLKKHMQGLGLELKNWEEDDNAMEDGDGSKINAVRTGRDRVTRKRKAELAMNEMLDGDEQTKVKRSQSRPGPRDKSGMRDAAQVAKAVKQRAEERITRMGTYYGQRNEGDRHIATAKPKHLFSGKRGIGSTDRR